MTSVEEDWLVEVWIYDLSQGFARTMSRQLLGHHIEGIWHSSIVVYGEEHFYGGGIQSILPPGSSPYGVPLRKIELGRTRVPQELFKEFIENIREKYLPERYHLFDNNCNNFSNDAAVFLTGKTIPEDVRSLPQEVMNTPFGQMIRPIVDRMFQPQPSDAVQRYTRQPSTLPSAERLNPSDLVVRHVSSMNELQQWIETHKGVLVDFDSPTCGPCIALAPYLTQFAERFVDILFCRVDIQKYPTIASYYRVQATPTLLAFKEGHLIETITGMNIPQIEQVLRSMESSIKAQQIPRRDSLVNALPKNSIVFDHMQVKTVFHKLRTMISSEHDFLNELELFLSKPDYRTSPSQDSWTRELFRLYESINQEYRFIVLDIMRMLVLNEFWLRNVLECLEIRDQFLQLIEELLVSDDRTPRALRLMMFRLTCNMFVHETLMLSVFKDQKLLGCLMLGLTNGALSEDVSVRETAASLAFNVSLNVKNLSIMQESLIEFVCSLHHALISETSHETRHRLLCALSYVSTHSSSEITSILVDLGFIDYLGHLTSQDYPSHTRDISRLLADYLSLSQ